MIRGVGVDIVSVSRLAGLIARFGRRAETRLFTPAELADCAQRRTPTDCLAGRFAAKEACLKALGTGLAGGVRWHDIGVRLDPHGRPELALRGRAEELLRELGADRALVSLSHDAGLAIALVVLEGDRDQME